jgi:hypothetical protein
VISLWQHLEKKQFTNTLRPTCVGTMRVHDSSLPLRRNMTKLTRKSSKDFEIVSCCVIIVEDVYCNPGFK